MTKSLIVLALGFFLMNCSSGLTVGGEAAGVSGRIELKLTSFSPKEVVQTLSVNGNGTFRFPDPLEKGATYNVTVNANPLEQSCSVVNPNSNKLMERVWNIQVRCVARGFDINR